MPTADFAPLMLLPSDMVTQTRIRPPLPLVVGNKDYSDLEALLFRIEEILSRSCVEDEFVMAAVARARVAAAARGDLISGCQRETIKRYAKQTMRCTIARIVSGNESLRKFSRHLADSPLLQWFCGVKVLGVVQVPSKSSLQRMESDVPEPLLRYLNAMLVESATEADSSGASVIGLADPLMLSLVWIDSTCAKLDIHYPVDWILLRDATRTIMKAVIVIRSHGLVHH